MTHSLYTDAIERARRRLPLALPAELQWNLLPPLSFISPRVSVAGILAPSTAIAGDSFDYSVNGDVVHVAIIDAMGHGIEATLLAAVTIGVLRNSRRRGDLGIKELVPVLDEQLAAIFGPDKFVTGIFGELDTTTGVWTWTTCGHPPALLVRRGRVVKQLDAVIAAPSASGSSRASPTSPPSGSNRATACCCTPTAS
jgi:serine phosphatase RsbU (regulator of sigma subunit)